MADRPEDATTWFEVLVEAKEWRTYSVPGNSEDEARVAFLSAPNDYEYVTGDDCGDPEVVEIWEA